MKNPGQPEQLQYRPVHAGHRHDPGGNQGKELADRELITYTIMRLAVIPAVILVPCLLLKLPDLVTGVSVLLAGMPAGATTSILASKYHCDEKFGTKLVVFSTAFSLITIPVWSMLLT